jgi:hypothetical protein
MRNAASMEDTKIRKTYDFSKSVKNPYAGRLRKQSQWMRYAGLIESGNRKSSQSVDEIVYGKKD